MDAQRIGANAFLLIGLGALAGAAALGRGAVNFDRRARHVRGTVVEVSEPRRSNGEAFGASTVLWLDAADVPHTFVLYSQSALDHAVGQTIDLRWDPTGTEPPVAGSALGDLAPGLILGVLGVGFAGIGARARWRQRKNA